MSAECPKCSYIRKPTDEAPAWQCPKCGIAIAKYIELQKEAALRKVTQREQRAQPVVKRESERREMNFGFMDGISSSMGRRALYVVGWVLGVGVVRLMFGGFHPAAPTNPPPMSPQPVMSSFPQTAPVAVAPPVSREPQLPTDLFKEEFAAAHERGEANGLFIPNADSRGLRGLDPLMPVKVHVERREAPAGSGCDHFGVTLTQGGDQRLNTRGEMMKSAYTMHFVYSLNYCIDGSMPTEGRNIKIEQN
jgi:ribosomal protein L37AE/L43A